MGKKLLFSLLVTFVQIILYAQTSKLDSLENALRQHPQEDTVRVNLLNDIAINMFPVDFDKAYRYIAEADTLSVRLKYLKGEAASLYYYGYFFSSKGDHRQAVHYNERAIKIYEELGDILAISKCSANTGTSYTYLGNYPLSLEYFQKSLTAAEKLGNKQLISFCLVNMGDIYHSQGNLTLALDYCFKALKIAEEIENKTYILLGYGNIGRIYQSEGKYSQALEYEQKALTLAEEIENPNAIVTGLENIAEIHILLNNYDQALKCLQRSLHISEETEFPQGVCDACMVLGSVYLKLHNYSDALNYTLKSLFIADETQAMEYQAKNHLQLSEIYSATGKYQKAFDHFKEYKVINDSIFNEKNIEEITGLEYTYRYEKEKQEAALEQQKRDAIHAEKDKQEGIIFYGMVGGFVFLLLLVLILMRFYRDKWKSNRLLTSKNLVIQEKNEELISQKEILERVNRELKFQKEDLQTILDKLKATQAHLIQSEKMAALGKLIAGVAHEVNTPLGTIKSSADEIAIAYQENLKVMPAVLRNLSENNFEEFVLLLNKANCYSESKSTREERQIKHNISDLLENHSIENHEYLASQLTQIGIRELSTKELAFLQENNPEKIIAALYNLSIQYRNNENVRLAANKASRVILALKNYSRTQNEGEMHPVDIAKGIDTVLTIYQNQLKKGITVVKNIEEVPCVNGFPDKLNQIWTNLIQNAIQAMNYSGTLTIKVKPFLQQSIIVVSVGDTGTGIAEANYGKVFEPFFTTKPEGEGSGLGLDIVKKIVEEHKGSIYFDSEEGRGTTFFVEFPVDMKN